MEENGPKKFDFIDALRGYAILGVVLVHTQWIAKPGSHFLESIVPSGAKGVQLFFVVSAFTLFLSMESRFHKESKPISKFYIRRFFRIAPMLYIAILGYSLWMIISKDTSFHWWHIPLAAIFMNGWLPSTINSLVPGIWSIAVEFTFYLIAPIIFIKIKKGSSAGLLLIITITLSAVLKLLLQKSSFAFISINQLDSFDIFLQQWFFSQLPVFIIGIIVYFVYTKYHNLYSRKLGVVLLGSSLLLLISFFNASTYRDILSTTIVYGIAFGFLILALHFGSFKIIINPIACWIGKISFSLYLIHTAVDYVLLYLIFPKGFPISGQFGFILAYLLVLSISCGLSILTYKYIELPGINLGKKLISKINVE